MIRYTISYIYSVFISNLVKKQAQIWSCLFNIMAIGCGTYLREWLFAPLVLAWIRPSFIMYSLMFLEGWILSECSGAVKAIIQGGRWWIR
jgi:hypothetical protein